MLKTFLKWAAISASLILPMVGGANAQTKAPVDITFTTDFILLGRYAPWYTALAKGYYKDAGLNVTIVPGKGTAQALQALESGVAQIAFSDVASLVLARAHGASTAKFVMINYQKAPYAVFSLAPGANVTKPDQLKGLEIASGAGSFTPKVIRGFMKEHKLDPDSVKFVNVDGSARVGMLLSGKVPAIETFIFGKAGIGRAVKTGKLETLLLSDFGLELYANGILVREDFLKSNPDVVRAFVKASLLGWRDALRDPNEAANLEAKYVPGLKHDVAVDELGIVRNLAVTPDTQAHGLGWIDAARMAKSVAFIEKYIGVEGKAPAASDLYTLDYLPKEPVKP